MNLRLIIAILISFGFYLLPIPSAHTVETWGGALWTILSSSGGGAPSWLTKMLMIIFAIGYQIFVAYFVNRIMGLKLYKSLLLMIPAVIILYIGLVLGLYVTLVFSMHLESWLGLAR